MGEGLFHQSFTRKIFMNRVEATMTRMRVMQRQRRGIGEVAVEIDAAGIGGERLGGRAGPESVITFT